MVKTLLINLNLRAHDSSRKFEKFRASWVSLTGGYSAEAEKRNPTEMQSSRHHEIIENITPVKLESLWTVPWTLLSRICRNSIRPSLRRRRVEV